MNCHQLRGLKQHKLITLSFWTSEVQKWVLQRCLQAWRLWEEAISLPLAAFRNWWSCITPTSASPSHLLHWPSPSHLSLTGILVITRGHLDNPRGSLPLSVLNWITAEVPLSCKVTYSQVPQIRMWTSSRRSLFCLLIPSYAQENKGAIINPRSHSLRVELALNQVCQTAEPTVITLSGYFSLLAVFTIWTCTWVLQTLCFTN